MRKLNKIIILCLILIMPFIGKTQYINSIYVNDSVENEIQNEIKREHYKKNNVYFELFGNGVVYSIGYERILLQWNNYCLSVANGFTYFPHHGRTKESIGLSPQLNFFYGEKHRIEFGIGILYMFPFESKQQNSLEVISYRIGYRYQKMEGGLFYKFGFTPFTPISWNIPLLPSGGAAIGYTF